MTFPWRNLASDGFGLADPWRGPVAPGISTSNRRPAEGEARVSLRKPAINRDRRFRRQSLNADRHTAAIYMQRSSSEARSSATPLLAISGVEGHAGRNAVSHQPSEIPPQGVLPRASWYQAQPVCQLQFCRSETHSHRDKVLAPVCARPGRRSAREDRPDEQQSAHRSFLASVSPVRLVNHALGRSHNRFANSDSALGCFQGPDGGQGIHHFRPIPAAPMPGYQGATS